MIEMPERIWALPETRAWLPALDGVEPKSISTTYVRADLVAKLVEALEPFVPPHKDWMDDHPDDRPSALYMQTTFGQQRAARAALARAKGGG